MAENIGSLDASTGGVVALILIIGYVTPLNALLPIVSTVAGTVTSVMLPLPAKALSAIL